MGIGLGMTCTVAGAELKAGIVNGTAAHGGAGVGDASRMFPVMSMQPHIRVVKYPDKHCQI